MPLDSLPGYRVNVGDTAELRHNLFDEYDLVVPEDSVAAVQFTIQKPDRSQSTHAGVVNDDGSGFYRWTDTTDAGEYKYIATFTLDSGQVKSVRGNFEVVDPFNPPAPTGLDILSDAVWMKFEDVFDSTEGGPWLRDETMAYFDKTKIPQFVGEAILDINLAPPASNVTLDYFTTPGPDDTPDPDLPILAQATYLAVIRHLMRSYVEQPLATGSQVFYEDRRDYLQRWQVIYQLELERFNRIVALWKRSFIGLGHGKLLVGAKAGRLLPAPLRTRNVGRGWL